MTSRCDITGAHVALFIDAGDAARVPLESWRIFERNKIRI
jgi:hypothetical protein